MNCAFLTAFAVLYNILISPSYGAPTMTNSGLQMNSNSKAVQQGGGGGGRVHNNPLVVSSGFGTLLRKRSEDGSTDDYYHDYYYQDQEEPECSEEGHFWHIRGLRCVPFDCPGGNQFRDKHTGECLLSRYGVTEGSKVRPSRLLNRQKTPTKFRLPFGLTLKG